MVNFMKLKLVKILLNNKRNRVHQIIDSLENINSFIEESGSPTSFVKDSLTEVEIVQVSDCFYQLFEIIEPGINIDLRIQFNLFSDEFSSETLNWSNEMLDGLIADLKFYEIKRIDDAINKLDANINYLKK